MLRPMSNGEALDLALRSFRAVGAPILRLSAVPTLFCYLVLVFFSVFVAPGLFWTKDPQSLSVQAGEVAFVFAMALFVAFPLFMLGISYTSGLVTRLVSDFILGNQPDEVSATSNARQSLFTMSWASLLTIATALLIIGTSFTLLFLSAYLEPLTNETNAWPAVVAFVASVGLFVGFLAFPVTLSTQALAPAAVVLEGLRGRYATRRSRFLMKAGPFQEAGSGKMVMLWLVSIFIFLAIYLGTTMAFEIVNIDGFIDGWLGIGNLSQIAHRMVGMLPFYLSLWILIPLWAATTTIIYYDRRIRLEGYDIEVLSMDARRTSRQSRFQI